MTKQLTNIINGNQWPELLDSVVSEESAKLTLDVKETLAWFRGHFPEQAVLPGVVQLHWVTQLARYLFVDLEFGKSQFKQASNIKFKSMILPGQLISLSLNYNKNNNKVSFSFSSEIEELSSGVLVFSIL